MVRPFLFSLMLASALAGCAGEPAPEAGASTPPPPEGPRVELEGATLTETVDGQKAWALTAGRVDYRQEAGIAELSEVHARFFEEGVAVSEGVAPRAIFHLGDRRLQLLGGIRVEAEEGDAGFTAHEVTWLPAEGRLAASGEVTFWRGGHRLTGGALRADRRLEQVHLTGGVRGRAVLDLPGTAAASVPSPIERTP